jgi:hypothetical protein
MDENVAREAFAACNIELGKRKFHLISNATGPWTTQPMPSASEARA